MLVDLVKSILGVVMTYAQENQANTCEVVFLDKSERYFWLNSDFIEENLKHKKRRTNSSESILRLCDRDRIRTYDRLLRRQMLYPAELRDLLFYHLLSGP